LSPERWFIQRTEYDRFSAGTLMQQSHCVEDGQKPWRGSMTGRCAMKKLLMIAASAGALAMFASSASAAPWSSIRDREANLNERIDQGIHSGALTRGEAIRLRSDLRSLEAREVRYRTNGLSMSERRDLDRRFDALSARVRFEKHDAEHR